MCCVGYKTDFKMKAPKKPKYKALPKAPKMSASDNSWKSYDSRLKAVQAENAKLKSEYEKKLKAYEAEIKRREAIKAKAQKKF